MLAPMLVNEGAACDGKDEYRRLERVTASAVRRKRPRGRPSPGFEDDPALRVRPMHMHQTT
jgi:hypothetical protein